MKKILSILLACILVAIACLQTNITATKAGEDDGQPVSEFASLSDPALREYLEDEIYTELVEKLDSDKYFVENVSSVYISEEYLKEVAYNSKANIYFGYNLADLENAFQGTKYVFCLGEDGQTTVKAFEEYDDTYDQIIRNVAIGTGVILLCVTVSVVTGGAGAAAISMIFATAAKTGTVAALSSGVISGTAAGIVTGIETGDFDEALKSAALTGGEGYKWGAITGALSGGASEAIALKGATLHGLTMNEAATIQKETKWSLDFIKNIHSVEEANIYRMAGLGSLKAEDVSVLSRVIDWDIVDDLGRTNAQRVLDFGLAPLDSTGIPYEVHHVGQQADSLFAILTKSEHMSGGNNKILHYLGNETEADHGTEWAALKKVIWKAVYNSQH